MIYAWHELQWQQIQNQFKQQKIPHALLLSGVEGLGKFDFAQRLARLLLCQKPGVEACGFCKSCELFSAQTHPDLKILKPEEPGKQIKIDEVRHANEFIAQTAQQGGQRVVIIYPAEALNNNASNALLKSLEEPGNFTFFILVTHQLGRLTATIRSRCQKIIFPPPDTLTALSWLKQFANKEEVEQALKLAQGAPLLAKQLIDEGLMSVYTQMNEDLISLLQGRALSCVIAESWSKENIALLLAWLAHIVGQLIKKSVGLSLVLDSKLESITQLVALDNVAALYAISERIQQTQLLIGSTANPNKQMLLEGLLPLWVKLAKR